MQNLAEILAEQFGGRAEFAVRESRGEISLDAPAAELPATLQTLRDAEPLHFEQLMDLAGMDYLQYSGRTEGRRFAAVYHFLSLRHNHRLRVRAFCPDDDFPQLPTATEIWPAADWFEREAFDLFGIVFHGHKDLRRILTDYGFVGHPFRKDFPISGHVEMRYDSDKKRVVYVPVSIPPREVTPRITREESFAKGRDDGGN
ncbi:MAG: NADH-quinone oxidoreductase subunit C [Betaproteobacteria bacterium]|nr:NADH-quinone oxidoreductase subunit C [Betaproteobacteria bacterium]